MVKGDEKFETTKTTTCMFLGRSYPGVNLNQEEFKIIGQPILAKKIYNICKS